MTLPPSASGDRRLHVLNAYEAKTDLLLSALALVYLITYSAQMIFYRPDEAWYMWATSFGYFLWLLFVVDLAFRIGMSPHRWHYIRPHLLDLVTVAVPQLRALRVRRKLYVAERRDPHVVSIIEKAIAALEVQGSLAALSVSERATLRSHTCTAGGIRSMATQREFAGG